MEIIRKLQPCKIKYYPNYVQFTEELNAQLLYLNIIKPLSASSWQRGSFDRTTKHMRGLRRCSPSSGDYTVTCIHVASHMHSPVTEKKSPRRAWWGAEDEQGAFP